LCTSARGFRPSTRASWLGAALQLPAVIQQAPPRLPERAARTPRPTAPHRRHSLPPPATPSCPPPGPRCPPTSHTYPRRRCCRPSRGGTQRRSRDRGGMEGKPKDDAPAQRAGAAPRRTGARRRPLRRQGKTDRQHRAGASGPGAARGAPRWRKQGRRMGSGAPLPLAGRALGSAPPHRSRPTGAVC
jgi:hypothetical protein